MQDKIYNLTTKKWGIILELGWGIILELDTIAGSDGGICLDIIA